MSGPRVSPERLDKMTHALPFVDPPSAGDDFLDVINDLRDARTALAAAQTDAAHWCEKYDVALGKLAAAERTAEARLTVTNATLARERELLGRIAAAERERDEARLDVRTLQAAPDMNGDAIMEARASLKRYLGVSADFFDDCIHNAVALCLQARESRDAAVALAEALRKIIQQAVDADAFAEWFTDTEHDGVDVAAALALTDAAALEALRERVRAEALEEAAKLADKIAMNNLEGGKSAGHVAAALRALAGGRKGDGNGA